MQLQDAEMTNRYDNAQLELIANAPCVDPHPEMGVDDFVTVVLRHWRDADPRTDQTVTRMGEIVVRFSRRLRATGIETIDRIDAAACSGFIDAPSRTGEQPADATRHFRRVTLRALFRTGRAIGVAHVDPTLDLALPPRSSLAARPLTDDEVMLCRTAAFPVRAVDLKRPAAWALAEASAATSEIPTVRRRDLRPASGVPEAVALAGTRRLRPRTVELTAWGVTILTRRLDELPDAPETLLAYNGHAHAGTVARHAAACRLIAAVLHSCGLGNEPDVRPASVRHWRARRAFDEGATVEEIATMLGHRRLDEAAAAIGHDWTAR
jgi:integrase/recombinase XerC